MRRFRLERARERGAVIVETLIVMPLLLLLVLGGVEVGMIVRDLQTAVAATRSAARVTSSAGDSRLADYDAIASLQASLSELDPADVVKVTIFRAEGDGAMPAACEGGSIDNYCNVYTGAEVFGMTAADFPGASCAIGSPDHAWCPTSRETDLNDLPDWVGIRVVIRHRSIAPFLGDRTLTETAVMRLEPRLD